MSSQMLRQTVLALELHAALLADVLDFMQLHVTVQVLLGLELLLAGLALEHLHLRLVLVVFVKVEGRFARIRRTAYVANARFRVVVLHVGGVVGLNLEHLAALFALVVVVLGVLPYVVDLQVRFGASLEVAHAARVQGQRFVVHLHVPAQMGGGFEGFRANGAFVGPRVAVLQHVPGVLALAIERRVTDLARVQLLQGHVLTREHVLLLLQLLPEVQRHVVQVLDRLIDLG